MANTRSRSGRPPRYSDRLVERICALIAQGQSIREFAGKSGIPASSTIYRWLGDPKYRDFWERYRRARELQAEVLVDEILAIADDTTGDVIERKTRNGPQVVPNPVNVRRAELRVQARRWWLEKLAPTRYKTSPDGDEGAKNDRLPFDPELIEKDPAAAYKQLLALT